MHPVFLMIKHDLTYFWRQKTILLSMPAFFILATLLFPFGVGIDTSILGKIAGGVIWICALLASILSTTALFADDAEDGTLTQLLTTGIATEYIVIAKMTAHWLINGLSITIIAPILAVLLYLPSQHFHTLIFSLLLGTPILSMIGCLAACLTLGIKRKTGLIAVLVLPFYIPVLIFATSMIINRHSEAAFMLTGLLFFFLPITLWLNTIAINTEKE